VMTRQQLLRLRSSLGFSQNVLQFMGTFSRERNWPAPDWPNLSAHLSDGRFNMNNLALVIPNPGECNTTNGRKKGWQTGKNRNQARQVDFFQLLNYVLNIGRGRTDHCGGTLDTEPRTFGIGASLIDQYDSGADCQTSPWGPGCDLDSHVNSKYRTHTTVIEY